MAEQLRGTIIRAIIDTAICYIAASSTSVSAFFHRQRRIDVIGSSFSRFSRSPSIMAMVRARVSATARHSIIVSLILSGKGSIGEFHRGNRRNEDRLASRMTRKLERRARRSVGALQRSRR